ncbi:hypothetical protein DY000_02052871 [Brassica cretica]|uniref:Uncharacterized protein n=1 Tax=Brassica cretica TaxID=69181 RepID=A0ABQ7A4K9_BRACR|nr:hypothetical protein DY000_02052871 [Brassica cretica]
MRQLDDARMKLGQLAEARTSSVSTQLGVSSTQLGPGGLFSGSWNRNWVPEAMVSSPRSGDRIGTLVYLDPEAAWEPGESYYAFEAVLEPEGLDPEIVVWNPEEPGGSSLDCEIFDWNPEAIGELGGTVLRLPRQDYYRYLFGFRILLLGRWPLSSSYAVFYFCRKSLTGLEGAGVGVVTQVPGLRSFPPRSILIHVLFTLVLWGPRCALGCTGVSGSFDSILRLAHTHSCFMSHTRFDSLWACHCGRATFVRVGQDRSRNYFIISFVRRRLAYIGGVPAVGLYFTFAILQPVGACSPHLDDLIGSGTPMRLRLHRGFRIGGLWRPDPARMPL